TVTLLGSAPASGAVVTLLSGNTSLATTPSSVTVPGNATSANFTVNTVAVTASMQVTISASYGGQTQTATLTVNPIVPALSLNPQSTTSSNIAPLASVTDSSENVSTGQQGTAWICHCAESLPPKACLGTHSREWPAATRWWNARKPE